MVNSNATSLRLVVAALSLFIGLGLFIPRYAQAQFTLGYHQSQLPMASFGYEWKEKWRPELRLSTDVYLQNLSAEGVLLLDLRNRAQYEVYVGAGVRGGDVAGLVIPAGVNIFPFSERKFGFHIELTPVLFGSYDSILRGSWGIRYRFVRENP